MGCALQAVSGTGNNNVYALRRTGTKEHTIIII